MMSNLSLWRGVHVDTCHHDQTLYECSGCICQGCLSLVSVIDDFGNPFEGESTDLLALNNMEISCHSSVETVGNVRNIGQQQFQAFTKKWLIKSWTPIDDVIHHNNLKLFGWTAKKVSKCKQQLTYLKYDVGLLSRIYIACQTRDGKLEVFFCQDHHFWTCLEYLHSLHHVKTSQWNTLGLCLG